MTVTSYDRRFRRVPPQHNDPSSWLHRGEVARLLALDKNTVRNLAETGVLHPIRDTRGDYLYDPDEVHAYAVSHPKARGPHWRADGELAAEATQLFSEGKSRREVVMALKITYATADKLYEEWKTPSFDEAIRKRKEQSEAERQARAALTEERRRARKRIEAFKTMRVALTSSRQERPPR